MENKRITNMDKKKKLTPNQKKLITFIALLILVVVVILIAVLSGKGEKGENKDVNKTTTKSKTETTVSTTEKEKEEKEEKTETTTKLSEVKTDKSIFDTDSAYAENHTYCVAVNTKQNIITIYGKDSNNDFTVAVKAMACSCGKSGSETPQGTYKTSERVRWLSMVDGTWGQYTTCIGRPYWFHSVPYFTKDNSDLEYEEYNKLGSPASLGCIRINCADAKWIYDNLEWNTIVKVYSSDSKEPLSKPETIKIDINSGNRGWDPTDPDTNNPW